MMLDPIYFPFTEEQLLSHFASVRNNGECTKCARAKDLKGVNQRVSLNSKINMGFREQKLSSLRFFWFHSSRDVYAQ